MYSPTEASYEAASLPSSESSSDGISQISIRHGGGGGASSSSPPPLVCVASPNTETPVGGAVAGLFGTGPGVVCGVPNAVGRVCVGLCGCDDASASSASAGEDGTYVTNVPSRMPPGVMHLQFF